MIIIIMNRKSTLKFNLKFVDRESEKRFLEDSYKKEGLQVIIIYGRRRVGKTELIKEFIKDKDAVYFLADQRGTAKNLERFAKQLQDFFSLPPLKIGSFEDVFKIVAGNAKKKKVIMVIDEFSYLIEKDPALTSVFQFGLDEVLKETNTFLILCGSSMGMMERSVLSYKSPLYGRRTGQIKLKPVEFKDLKSFFPKYSVKELIEAYGILGGVPAYLKLFDPNVGVFKNIENTFFIKEHLFYQEPEIILKEELREPKVYLNLLEAMAKGKTKLTDISNFAGINAKDAGSYLNVLMELDLVERIYPVTEKKSKSKKTLYFIKDNFFVFWFRFILGNMERIERGQSKILLEEIKKEFQLYTGKIFEKVCKEFLWAEQPFPFTKIGKWWSGENEIDLVALNERARGILFAECKWQDRKVDEGVARNLIEKTKFVDWNRNKRKEYFALFSRSGFTGACLDFCEKNGVRIFDLDALEKVFKDG
jgi:hypothetical protein